MTVPAGMQASSATAELVRAALAAVEALGAPPLEKAEMLMEVAMGLQIRPRTVRDLEAAVQLYECGLRLCDDQSDRLLEARIRARLGTALMGLPDAMERARTAFATAMPTLAAAGTGEELAEAEMNLGLVLQQLAASGTARIQDSIAAYQRALRVFDRHRHPREFAILQNNLATAFLSIPLSDDRARLRETLAVQAFEEGLAVVTLVDHPAEYAMLQNNLGNALQTASAEHRLENGYRALEAYDEALKVRDRRTMPNDYASTIANRAGCLSGLPDDPACPGAGNPRHLAEAAVLYREAHGLFTELGEVGKAASVADALDDLLAALPRAAASP